MVRSSLSHGPTSLERGSQGRRTESPLVEGSEVLWSSDRWSGDPKVLGQEVRNILDPLVRGLLSHGPASLGWVLGSKVWRSSGRRFEGTRAESPQYPRSPGRRSLVPWPDVPGTRVPVPEVLGPDVRRSPGRWSGGPRAGGPLSHGPTSLGRGSQGRRIGSPLAGCSKVPWSSILEPMVRRSGGTRAGSSQYPRSPGPRSPVPWPDVPGLGSSGQRSGGPWVLRYGGPRAESS